NIVSCVVFPRFFPKTSFRALFLGDFFSKHRFVRCFSKVFSQNIVSRVVFPRLFSKTSFRALFFQGFSQNTLSRVVFRRLLAQGAFPMYQEYSLNTDIKKR
ncbi:hypothetical protein, partial [Segatella oulorum]|uniref:hypothetical protein n=1 Tax=Segatella oulorum TaxID=28136 RepID=UPI0028EF3ABC